VKAGLIFMDIQHLEMRAFLLLHIKMVISGLQPLIPLKEMDRFYLKEAD
jgi:hypothetical protein